MTYQVNCYVTDIRNYDPKKQDKIYVDTNVWLWMAYSKISYSEFPPKEYQLSTYPNFLQRMKEVDCSVYWSAFNISELAHIIEKVEYSIYKKTAETPLPKKEYRYSTSFGDFLREIDAAYELIRKLGKEIYSEHIKSLDVFKKIILLKMDGYDAIHTDLLEKNKVSKILTDDIDYISIEKLQILTANNKIINLAKSQDKDYQP